MKKWNEIDVISDSFYPKVSSFLESNFGNNHNYKLWDPKIFKWKLSEMNPAGKGYMYVATLDREVIGVATLTKKLLLINGKKVLCGEIGDTYTHPKYRRNILPKKLLFSNTDPSSYENKSIFGRLVSSICNKAKAEGINLIYGTPNENSYPGYTKKLNFIDVKALTLVPYSRVTSKFIENNNDKFNHIFIFIFKVFEFIFRHILNLLHNLFGCIYKLKIVKHTPTEEQINLLWKENKLKTKFSMYKNFSYWKHRYINHPNAKYNFFSIYKSKKFIGFYVTRIVSLSNKEKQLCIIDWMLLKEEFLFFSINKIIHFFNKEKIHKIIVWKLKSYDENIYFKLNFFFERKRVPIIFKSFFKNDLNLKDANVKVFLMGSTDVI